MTSYNISNVVFHNLIFIWYYAVLLFLFYITVQYIRQKRVANIIMSILFVAANYSVFQMAVNTDLSDIIIRFLGLSLRVGLIVYMIVQTLAVIILLFSVNKWEGRNISQMSVKESVDLLPTAICVYYPSGKIILVNESMNNLSRLLTGMGVLNGNELYSAVEEGRLLPGCETAGRHGEGYVLRVPGGKYFSFMRKERRQGGRQLFEITSNDITEIYRKTAQLDKNNRLLEQANEKIREYSRRIIDITRQKEIVKTKTEIHDGMNLVLLRSRRIMKGGTPAEKAEILFRWKANALMLCREADTAGRGVWEKLQVRAAEIGMTAEIKVNIPPGCEKYEELIYSAGSEAAANAKKHADASVLYADISAAGDELIIRFSDNGSPKRPFRGEGGGLKDLRSRAESLGGRMETETAQGFAVTLYLKIPGETANV